MDAHVLTLYFPWNHGIWALGISFSLYMHWLTANLEILSNEYKFQLYRQKCIPVSFLGFVISHDPICGLPSEVRNRRASSIQLLLKHLTSPRVIDFSFLTLKKVIPFVSAWCGVTRPCQPAPPCPAVPARPPCPADGCTLISFRFLFFSSWFCAWKCVELYPWGCTCFGLLFVLRVK